MKNDSQFLNTFDPDHAEFLTWGVGGTGTLIIAHIKLRGHDRSTGELC